jgi:hypothetical protein
MIPYRYMEKLALGRGVLDHNDPVFSGEAGTAEHLAHEVAHCILIGWRPFNGMEKAVGLTLRMDHDKGEAEEALVLASEEVTLRGLGIVGYDRGGARKAAAVQDVRTKVFNKAWGSPAARLLGLKVLRYIGRRCGCYRSGLSKTPAVRRIVMGGGL